MFVIDTERPEDAAPREMLLDAVMGAARFEKPSERLREGRLPAEGLSLVARDGGRLVGTVRLWQVVAGGRPMLLLGPLAVDCPAQGTGIGAALMRSALARALAAGHDAVILVGDPEYYERFGFSASAVSGLVISGPVEQRRFLGLALIPGAFDGARGQIVASGAFEALPLPLAA